MKKYTIEQIIELFEQASIGKVDYEAVGYAMAVCEDAKELTKILDEEIEKRKNKENNNDR